jgi:hypothetical protein
VTRPRSLPLLALLAAGAVASPASADPAGPADPQIASLPETRFTPLRSPKPPAHIPASERAEGFWVAYPGWQPRKKDDKPTMATVAASEAATQRLMGGTLPSTDPDTTCFALPMGAEREGDAVDWLPSYNVMASLPLRQAGSGYGYGGVRLVRSQRLVAGEGGRATLEIAHAWVDPDTRGVRFVSRESLPLARLWEGPGGLAVYGAHDGNEVEIVARVQLSKQARTFPVSLTMVAPNGMGGGGQCDHLAMRLGATLKGAAEIGTFAGEIAVVLPGTAAEDPPEIRVRSFRLAASESWLSRDPGPVLSVAFGWSGKARTELR